ncbi:hypothetical protein WJX74_002449 [Apatococcus lobatus]|uniref:Uncharacterized protein n=1 Tax=Apatococcus lobatus TaxID=904363 RepID=A0AAW1RZH3_9CHLO
MQSLAEVLDGTPDEPSLILAEKASPVLYRKTLLHLACALALHLRKVGLKPGNVVTLLLSNTPEFVIAFFGITLARAIAAPLNPAYRREEIHYFCNDAGTKLLLLSEGTRAEDAAKGLLIPTLRMKLQYPSESSGTHELELLGACNQPVKIAAFPSSSNVSKPVEHQLGPLEDGPRGDDVALLLHTSGTTSKPKAVPLTHANLVASLANTMSTYEMQPSDRSLLVMPLFHVHGLMAGCLVPLAAGGSVILPAEGRFAASTFWRDAVQHQATFFTAVPTMHQILLQRSEADYPRDTPPPLRFIRSCSSPLAPAVLESLEAAFGVSVLEAYAMTEASHQMTANPLPKHGPHIPGSVGTPQGSVRLTILDSHCEPVEQGHVGEVCALGPNITKGYVGRPEANKEAYAGGWFHTGDQGYMDDKGYLHLTGRIKELINRGGEKISPVEVDNALLSHPSVQEAVTFAAPDNMYGERVAAAVVLDRHPSNAAAAIADIKAQVSEPIAAFKVPEDIFICKSIPKAATGKIQRRKMVDVFIPDAS